MKIKTLVAMLFLSAGATTVVAQDATNCNSNSSISHEAVRAGNFKDAYTPWKAVLENCPTLPAMVKSSNPQIERHENRQSSSVYLG